VAREVGESLRGRGFCAAGREVQARRGETRAENAPEELASGRRHEPLSILDFGPDRV